MGTPEDRHENISVFFQFFSSLSRDHCGLATLSRLADGSKPMGTARSPEPVCGFSKPVPVVRITRSVNRTHVLRNALMYARRTT